MGHRVEIKGRVHKVLQGENNGAGWYSWKKELRKHKSEKNRSSREDFTSTLVQCKYEGAKGKHFYFNKNMSVSPDPEICLDFFCTVSLKYLF